MIYSGTIQFTKFAIFVKLILKTQEVKKKNMFLFHFGQTGGNRGNGQLQINVLKRGAITYYTTSFVQHGGFYNFYGEQIVDDFLMSVYNIFVPDKDYMIQGYAQIMNRHSRESSLLLKISGCG